MAHAPVQADEEWALVQDAELQPAPAGALPNALPASHVSSDGGGQLSRAVGQGASPARATAGSSAGPDDRTLEAVSAGVPTSGTPRPPIVSHGVAEIAAPTVVSTASSPHSAAPTASTGLPAMPPPSPSAPVPATQTTPSEPTSPRTTGVMGPTTRSPRTNTTSPNRPPVDYAAEIADFATRDSDKDKP